MAPIETNKIDYFLSREKLFESYDIFSIKTSEKYFKWGAMLLDAPLLDKGVCSVLYTEGNEFLVLMKKEAGNLGRLRSVLKDVEGGGKITVSRTDESDVTDDSVLQLLLNALGSYDFEILRFNNLTGHVYCSNPAWNVTDTKTGKILQIPCLEFKITDDYRMRMNVRTFTSISFMTKRTGRKHFEKHTQYVTGGKNQMLKRKTEFDCNEESYILRQVGDDRSEIPFLNLTDIEHFNESKMGVLAKTVELFNEKYKDIAKLGFESIEEYQSLECTNDGRKENKKNIEEQLSKSSIRIIDSVNERDSTEKCKQIQSMLKEIYGIDSKIGKRIDKDALNIRLIHNAEYYEEGEDVHKTSDKIALQHITMEDFDFDKKFALKAVVNEVLIKHDLAEKKISLYDWKSLGFEEDIEFGIKDGEEENERFYFMIIHPDGTFDIGEQKYDLFESNRYNQCIDIFDSEKSKAVKIHGIIRDEEGNINVIKDTGWYTIPDIFGIKKELSEGNTKLKGKEKRDELLPSVLDIKTFVIDGIRYYFVGMIGNGMRSNIERAALIRRLECYEQSQDLFTRLLPLMNVAFVRNGQLTVTPFPFKYLREYVKTVG